MKKKKYWILGAAVVLAVVLWAVNSRGNSLFQDVEPKSLMTLYAVDGKTGFVASSTDEKATKKILKKLRAVEAEPVTEWSPAYPMYGIEFGEYDYKEMLWTNGYLITRTGEAYVFDFDFAALLEELGKEEKEQLSVTGLPNAGQLADWDGMWHSEYMREVADPAPAPEGFSMTMRKEADGSFTIVLENDTEEDWSGDNSDSYRLHVKLDGKWYMRPIGSYAIASLPEGFGAGTVTEETRDYSHLPAGTYRLVKEINKGTIPENTFVRRYLTVEFEIP